MRRIFSLLLAILLVCTISMTTFASEIPDLSKSGKITVKMDCGGKPLNGGRLSIYQVGRIVENKNVYSIELIDELKESGLSLDNLDDPGLALELSELTKDLPEISAAIENGSAVFQDVKPGVYVVVQEESDTSEGAAAISPFLVSVPNEENGRYNYDVTADPKVPQETEPTNPDSTEPHPTEPDSTNPTDPESTEPNPTEPKPDEPKLPQTGQLNWPVPILVVTGLTLFIAGWILRFGRKKEQYEE